MAPAARRALGSLWLQIAAGPALAIAVLLAIDSGAVPETESFNVGLAAIYGVAVLSVSLLAGWSGVWSIGHPALLAIGAFTAGYGSAHGWALETVLLFSMVAAGACGALIGFAGARFSTLYIALLTLAFNLVALELIVELDSITGGDEGVPVPELSSALGLGSISSASGGVHFAIGLFGVALAVAAAVRVQPVRMRLVAAKLHRSAARAVGIAPEAQSALGFAVSGAFTAAAGVALAVVSGFVTPESFGLVLAINLIAATVLGGTGSIAGSVLGGAFIAWSPTVAQDVGVSQSILQGAVLIGVLLVLPIGVAPSIPILLRAVRRRLRPQAADPPHDAEPLAEAIEKSPRPEPGDPVLAVEEVTVRFGGLRVLHEVSLTARRGEILGVIGPNGAGKTTLINVISGLAQGARVEGVVRLEGRDLLRMRSTARRRVGIARTFQHAQLFAELTVLENLLCTGRVGGRAARTRALALLRSMRIAGVAERHPGELPFGLQKSVDLARAVTESPQLLLLDEPFGGLDEHERIAARNEIVEVNRSGTTVVIIDHVLDDLFAVADRVVAFDFGEVIAEGPPSRVIADPRVRSSYLGDTVVARSAPPAAPEQPGRPVVSLREVSHRYGGVVALRDVDLDIAAGTVLGIVGANGAGKSTLGTVVVGALRPTGGTRDVTDVDGRAPVMSLVPEGRQLFAGLTVRENLEVAAYGAGLRAGELKARIDEATEWLPERLRPRLSTRAGSLSGGEQQMVAIARSLVPHPDVLVLDEPALGLAPALVDEVYQRIAKLARQGMTVIVIDQLLGRAMAACQEVVVLNGGAVAARGRTSDPTFAEIAATAYFGGAGERQVEALQPS